MGSIAKWAAALLLTCLSGQVFSQPATQPIYGDITIDWDGQTLKAVATRPVERYAFSHKDHQILVYERTVEAIDAKGTRVWLADSKDGASLALAGLDMDTALFRGYQPATNDREEKSDPPLQLRRLDLKTGRWVSVFQLAPDAKPGQEENIQAVSADAGRLAVLTQCVVKEDDEPKVAGCRVVVYDVDREKPKWSTTLPSAPDRNGPGVFLLASKRPDYAHSQLKHLNWIGDDLVVCASEKSDIVCFSAEGEESWRVANLWEYQRGFIGPSVWMHYIEPFGIDDWNMIMLRDGDSISWGEDAEPGSKEHRERVDKMKAEMKTVRDDFNKMFECAIVGGPFVVGSETNRRLFVAVSKGPNDRYWGYLSDCLIYEISTDGQVMGLANLPRMANESQAKVDGQSIVWACQKGGMARLTARPMDNQFGNFRGDYDALSKMDWYREIPKPKTAKVWLTSDKASDETAFSEKQAFRTIAGGYVIKPEDKTYHCPITVIDLETGLDRLAVLNVPLTGVVPEPQSNYSRDSNGLHAIGPYFLGITRIRVEMDRLVLTLGMEGQAAEVVFDLPKPATRP